MYADLTSRDANATLKVTSVHDQYAPGVRIMFGPLYLSLSLVESVDLVDGLAAALAEIDRGAQAPELVQDGDDVLGRFRARSKGGAA